MAAVSIRRLDDDVEEPLRVRAARHARSLNNVRLVKACSGT